MDQVINMLLKGTTVELIVNLEPRLYRKYIWKNKNNTPMQLSKFSIILCSVSM